jgi:hypothetical protein
MTAIHDLLDAVSAGQPQATVSVDDLVRAGRRRHRTVASGVAAGTAVVVVVAALAGVTVLRQDDNHGSAADASAVPSNRSYSATAPIAGAPSNIQAVNTHAVIPAAHLFSGGTSVGTFVETMACTRPPELTVVSQDAQQVVVSLTVPGLGAPGQGTWLGTGATTPPSCEPFPSAGTGAEFHGPTFSGEVTAGLSAPLGTRTLVDAATGRAIPYTSDSVVAEPTWLPPGWGDGQPLQPTGLQTWEHSWRLGSSAEWLSLTQTHQATADLGGTANATVGTSEARLHVTATAIGITWLAAGWKYELSDYQTILCNPPVNGSTIATCPTPTAAALRQLTQAELLHVADSVAPR